ncbi:MAG: MarR family transcriptional regulator [Pseudomonadota bacterium]
MNEPSMPRLLLTAFRWFDDALRNSLVAQGLPSLTHSQSLVMSCLVSDGIRISELARRLDMTRQGAQKAVVALEAVGLVYTEADHRNSSAKIVYLTKLGLQSIESAQEIFNAVEKELTNRIGEKSSHALRKALEQDWSKPPTIR